MRRIHEYARNHDIELETIRFIAEPSERYLPRTEESDLDLVLIDGKHAFPWPVVDWFFTAEKLKCGGLMLVDDVPLRSVAILAQFMSADPGWELVHDFSGRTLAFRKIRQEVLDVAWHMQPWTVVSVARRRPGVLWRLRNSINRVLRRNAKTG